MVKDECSLEGLKRAQTENPSAIFVIQLALNDEFKWQVRCQPDYPLSLLLEKFPRGSFLFDVLGKSNLELNGLIASLNSIQDNPSVGIVSSSHIVSKMLRKEFPQWLFGADPTSMVKARFFNSLYIESMADLWPDFIALKANIKPSEKLHPRLIAELIRRKKLLIWEDDGTDAEIPAELKPEIRGVMTNRPSWIKLKFTK